MQKKEFLDRYGNIAVLGVIEKQSPPGNRKDNNLPKEFQDIIDKHSDRFKEPTTLPPERPEDMEINLTSTTVPRWRGIGKLNEA